MTLKTFISRLNWRLILVHFLAFGFFIFAFQTMFFLTDVKLMDLILNHDAQSVFNELAKRNIAPSEVWKFFALYPFYSGLVGLVLAFVSSLVIIKKNGWFWGNSLVVFIAALLLFFFEHIGWNIVRRFLSFPGRAIANSIGVEFIINSILFLAIGLFIFLSGFSRNFIEKKFVAVNH